VTFDELVADAAAAPIDGWDFGWLDGRATEERPPWGYARVIGERAARAERLLDLQSGGGEVLAGLDGWPRLLVASEGWPPNLPVAARHLRPRGGHVVAAHDDRAALPFRTGTFDLVTSRHPIRTWWDEVARVLRPGGRFVSQQVGPHTMRELSEALLGPLPDSTAREPRLAIEEAEAAGLVIHDLQEARLRAEFRDIGAIVWFLRLVVWTVPGFTVEGYRDELGALHEQIERDGSFVAHSTRFLIEASKPG